MDIVKTGPLARMYKCTRTYFVTKADIVDDMRTRAHSGIERCGWQPVIGCAAAPRIPNQSFRWCGNLISRLAAGSLYICATLATRQRAQLNDPPADWGERAI